MSGGAADLELDDRALAAAYLAARDEAAFRALYRRHTPALWPMVLRILGGSEEAAREAVQETWLRAAEGLPRFRWDSALRTWLTGIALNCAREGVRSERRGRGRSPAGGAEGDRSEASRADDLAIQGAPTWGTDPERAAERPPGAAPSHDVESPTGVGFPTGGGLPEPPAEPIDLARAVDALPEGYRTVLVLHDLEGYTHEEIARMLGIEAGTSKSQLHRARRRLRETLSGGRPAQGGEG